MNENIQKLTTRLEEIRGRLTVIGSRESSFTGVEILFYDAITAARELGGDNPDNQLLNELKDLERNEYQSTKQLFKKSSVREQAIRKFMVRLKRILKSPAMTNQN
jgi:hypothetical protein